MTATYSKRSLAIPTETTGRFFPLFIKSNWAIICQNCLISQVVMGNIRLLVS